MQLNIIEDDVEFRWDDSTALKVLSADSNSQKRGRHEQKAFRSGIPRPLSRLPNSNHDVHNKVSGDDNSDTVVGDKENYGYTENADVTKGQKLPANGVANHSSYPSEAASRSRTFQSSKRLKGHRSNRKVSEHMTSAIFSKDDEASANADDAFIPEHDQTEQVIGGLNFLTSKIHPLLISSLHRMKMTEATPIQVISLSTLIPRHLFNLNSGKSVKTAIEVANWPRWTLSEYYERLSSFKYDHASRPDYLLQSPTGSGKSLSYLLPILHSLLCLQGSPAHSQRDYFANPKVNIGKEDFFSGLDRSIGTFVIILTPTRELSIQLNDVISKLLAFPKTKGQLSSLLNLDSADASDDDMISNISVPRWIVPGCLLSGVSRSSEKARLRVGTTIVISTPGRLLDHLESTKHWSLDTLGWIVIEEADRFMEFGLKETLEKLWRVLDERAGRRPTPSVDRDRFWQLLLVSATLPATVESLAGRTLYQPILITPDGCTKASDVIAKSNHTDNMNNIASQSASTPSEEQINTGISNISIPIQIRQHVVTTPTKLRLVTLLCALRNIPFLSSPVFDHILNDVEKAAAAPIPVNPYAIKVVLFLSTCDSVDFFFDLLRCFLSERVEELQDEASKSSMSIAQSSFLKGFVYRLHGKRAHEERTEALKGFQKLVLATPGHQISLLLTTNVAARGLDFPDTPLIIQYDPPFEAMDYVHRVGRTARHGAFGRSILFLLNNEKQPMISVIQESLKNSSWQPHELSMQVLWKLWHLHASENSDVKDVDESPFRTVRMEEALYRLQIMVEDLLLEDDALQNLSSTAYLSTIRGYATYPARLRQQGMNPRSLHLGHYAKSFGLKDTPTHIKDKLLSMTAQRPTPMKAERKSRKRDDLNVSHNEHFGTLQKRKRSEPQIHIMDESTLPSSTMNDHPRNNSVMSFDDASADEDDMASHTMSSSSLQGLLKPQKHQIVNEFEAGEYNNMSYKSKTTKSK